MRTPRAGLKPSSDRRRTAAAPREASDTTYTRLRALIVSGALAPGSPLIESDIAGRLVVSRTPVRSALLRLDQQGFVRWAATGSKSRRAIVAPLTAEDLREVFLMLGALEGTAAREAARLDRAEREVLARELDQANATMLAEARRRPPELVAALDAHVRFHDLLVRAAAGPRLRNELGVLGPQAERYQRVYSAATMYAIEEFAAAHHRIGAAIRAGDPDGAAEATGADWRTTADRYHELVSILGERGNW